ncbi:MAG: hypothetical protein N2486_08045 [Caloramator sp.]|nr:hypothetical protein [Caloramator sp.]
MKIKFRYYYPDANKVSVVGDFNNWDGYANVMTKNEDGIWEEEILIGPGKHRYRFLIDDVIKVNDPYANIYVQNENDELDSLIIIDEEGRRLINEKIYNVHLEDYIISDSFENKNIKKRFNFIDEKVITRLEFTEVTGVHTVTLLWFKPNGEVYYVTENILIENEDKKEQTLWFWININERIMPGQWRIRLLIDGLIVFDDYFSINPNKYDIINKKIVLK